MRSAIFSMVALASSVSAQVVPDYPGKPDEHGSVVLVLDLNVEGKITNCVVQRASLVQSLDSAACRIVMEVSRLQPATDYNGKPRASRRYFTVHFVIPRATQTDADLPIEGDNKLIVSYNAARAVQHSEVGNSVSLARSVTRQNLNYPAFYPTAALKKRQQGSASVAVVVDARGTPSACFLIRTSGYSDLDAGVCKFAMTYLKYDPGTDAMGRPISDIDVFTMNFRLF